MKRKRGNNLQTILSTFELNNVVLWNFQVFESFRARSESFFKNSMSYVRIGLYVGTVSKTVTRPKQ